MKTNPKIKVWDLVVRVFHWTLVVAFSVAFITEEDILELHVWVGYLVLVAVLLRILWGFMGNRYARFSNFITAPKTALVYVYDSLFLKAKRYLGHNPAGGLMILVMLVSLLVTTITGIAVYGAEEQAGLMATWFDYNSVWQDIFEELHEIFANFTLLLVIVHVLGVIVESLIHKENLVRSMINGIKKAD